MAIASGQAGRVLARPLFCRLNMYVRTLNTREVVRSKSYMGHSTSNQHKNYLTLTDLDETWCLHSVCWDIHP